MSDIPLQPATRTRTPFIARLAQFCSIAGIITIFCGMYEIDNRVLADLLSAWHWISDSERLADTLYSLALLFVFCAVVLYLCVPQPATLTTKITTAMSVLIVGGVLLHLALWPYYNDRSPDVTLSCISNQRQLAIAIVMYIQDYHRVPQDLSVLKGYLGTGKTSSNDIFICPVTTRRFRQHPGGYGMNGYLAGKQLSSKDIPPDLVLTADSRQMNGLLYSINDIAIDRHRLPADSFVVSYGDGSAKLVNSSKKLVTLRFIP